jgi:hypothetical protein
LFAIVFWSEGFIAGDDLIVSEMYWIVTNVVGTEIWDCVWGWTGLRMYKKLNDQKMDFTSEQV